MGPVRPPTRPRSLAVPWSSSSSTSPTSGLAAPPGGPSTPPLPPSSHTNSPSPWPGPRARPAARTAPVDADVNSAQPEWGTWNMINHLDTVQVKFDAVAAGDGGSY